MTVDYHAIAPRIMEACACARGLPAAHADFKLALDDFQVTEYLGFEPDGEGGHALLLVEKKGLNTADVAGAIARFAQVKPVAVGYCGLKDRQAITRQWFSVDLGNRVEPRWQDLDSATVRICMMARHRRKLRRGSHQANEFHVVLKNVAGDRDELSARLQDIAHAGVPNYFERQRFGRDGNNLLQALRLFQQTRRPRRDTKSGMYLSAARAFLFNTVLSGRVSTGTWNRALAGDVMMLEGSHSWFRVPEVTSEIEQRLTAADIHPTGPMWGGGDPAVTDAARILEQEALAGHETLCRGLEANDLKQERRALRLMVGDFTWQWSAQQALTLSFRLPPGTFATAVLRELVRF